jgi:hypothetical protein
MDWEGKHVRTEWGETASNNIQPGKGNGKLFNSSFKTIIFENKIRPFHLRQFF